ncbi:MAG: 2,3-bisphosphoglycerate-independent phosphoglycerate mutase [Raoultibacter sp.]|jgi:2,3-bisphosphoglycerate-independent phosphoglycerate mutase
MQYAIVILDGASGLPVPEFEGKTSLEASFTPYLDKLASGGTVGMVQNVPAHLVSGSDVACMSIMGYDPAQFTVGRGAIEAAALGIDLKPGQVAFRVNLCYVEDSVMRGYSTGNLSSEDGHALARELKEALDNEVFTLHLGTSFRQILVVDSYPEMAQLKFETPHDNTGLDITEHYRAKIESPEQEVLSELLAAYVGRANEVLAASPVNKRRVAEGMWPANFTWLFWPGERPGSLKPFSEVYEKSAAVNSGVDLLDGLAAMTECKIYHFDGVTDGPNNDYVSQGSGGIQMLEEGNDFVIVHVEAPDAAGHDGEPEEKRQAIEHIDKHIIGPLMEYAKTHPLRIAAMPDHPTPLATRKHSHDPVPFVLNGPGIPANGASRLTEKDAESTGLFIPEGHLFLAKWLFAE